MPEVYHIVHVEVLRVAGHMEPGLHHNGACAHSFLGLPQLARCFVGLRAGNRVRRVEPVGLRYWVVAVDVLGCELLVFQAEGADCGMGIRSAIYCVFVGDVAVLGDERGRDVVHHIEVAAINHSVHKIRF